MPTYGRWRGVAQNESGDVLGGASVLVELEDGGGTAGIYAARSGGAKANPFTADDDGNVLFYAEAGVYKITITSGGEEIVLRYEPVGTAQEYDVGVSAGQLLEKSGADGLYQSLVQDNTSGSGAPTASDDSTEGYSVRSLWFDTATSPTEVYICLDASVGLAVWELTSLTVDDLGSAATRNVGTGASDVPDITAADARYGARIDDLETLLHQGI